MSLLSQLGAALGDGLLPKWQLFVASTAVFNTVQNFVTVKLTRRVYAGTPEALVTPLQARTFGVWTLTSAAVRFYAAFAIRNKAVYELTFLTYAIAFAHFASEIFVFRSARLGAGTAGPIVVSTSSMIWMWNQYAYYVSP